MKKTCLFFIQALTICVLYASAAFSAPAPADCGAFIASNEATIFGQKIRYKYHYKNSGSFRISDLVENANEKLLIHITPSGHVSLIFDNTVIESKGKPGARVESQIKLRYLLGKGLLFAFSDLPETFKADFEAYKESFVSSKSITCVSSACKTLEALSVEGCTQGSHILVTSFLKGLIQSAAENPQTVEVIGLEKTPGLFADEISSHQTSLMAWNAILYAVPSSVLASAVGVCLRLAF